MEKDVFFVNTLKILLAPIPKEGQFQVMCVGTQQKKEQKEMNTREREGQCATKITSAPAESCIQFPWSDDVDSDDDTTHADGDKHVQSKHHRGFTDEIDEARFVRQYNFFHLLIRMLCLCLALMNLLPCVAPFF